MHHNEIDLPKYLHFQKPINTVPNEEHILCIHSGVTIAAPIITNEWKYGVLWRELLYSQKTQVNHRVLGSSGERPTPETIIETITITRCCARQSWKMASRGIGLDIKQSCRVRYAVRMTVPYEVGSGIRNRPNCMRAGLR